MNKRRKPGVRYAPTAARHGRVVAEKGAATWDLADRLDRLVTALGSNRVAELLDVSASQPSRWVRGEERPGPTSQRRLLDLEYVVARLYQLYPREQADIWLTSHNAHLGARPADVLRLQGAGPVIVALDAEAQGAYA